MWLLRSISQFRRHGPGPAHGVHPTGTNCNPRVQVAAVTAAPPPIATRPATAVLTVQIYPCAVAKARISTKLLIERTVIASTNRLANVARTTGLEVGLNDVRDVPPDPLDTSSVFEID